jgi:hypothetical protein
LERNQRRDENPEKKAFSKMGVLVSPIAKKVGKGLVTVGAMFGISGCVPGVTINNIPFEECAPLTNDCGTTTTVHLREKDSTAGQNHVNVENGVLRMTSLDRDADPDKVTLEFSACGEVDSKSVENEESETLNVKKTEFTMSVSVREDALGVIVDVDVTSACPTSADAGTD